MGSLGKAAVLWIIGIPIGVIIILKLFGII